MKFLQDIRLKSYKLEEKFQIFFTFLVKMIVYWIQEAVYVDSFFSIAYDVVIVDKNSHINQSRSRYLRYAKIIFDFADRFFFAVHIVILAWQKKLLLFAKLNFKTGNYFVKMCKFILNILRERERKRHRHVLGIKF